MEDGGGADNATLVQFGIVGHMGLNVTRSNSVYLLMLSTKGGPCSKNAWEEVKLECEGIYPVL